MRCARHGLSPEDIDARRFDARYVALMKELVARTRELFAEGVPLAEQRRCRACAWTSNCSAAAAWPCSMPSRPWVTTRSSTGPSIGTAARVRLAGRALAGRVVRAAARLHVRAVPNRPKSNPALRGEAGLRVVRAGEVDSVAASYAECRRVARAAASNFYYAFYMLPRPKRDALCALYAFMRLVDDVSDAPARKPLVQRAPRRPRAFRKRTAALARWRALLDQAVAGDASAHPILPAFADTIRRYHIPPRYFHDLISGAEMDLTETRYATFDRLREYCYRVAGTVGLTCLHVFGFDDPHAPELAEQLGIAFQLTNILRDVARRFGDGPRLSAGGRSCALRLLVEELARGVVTAVGARTARVSKRTRAWHFYARGRPADSAGSSRQPRRALGAGANLQHAAARASKTAVLTCSPSRVRLIVARKSADPAARASGLVVGGGCPRRA